MPEEPKPTAADPVAPVLAETPPPTQQDQENEIGDFITRHVLEKDSVFFEG
jgi:hypothetical protein